MNESNRYSIKFVFRTSIFAAMAVMFSSGCKSIESTQNHRTLRLANDAATFVDDSAFQNNGYQTSQLAQSNMSAGAMLQTRVKNGQANIELLEAIQLGLSNSRVVRVTDGDSVNASSSTFYDIETAEARELATLSAFDATFEASIYGRDVKRPPNALFGPGLIQPLSRDEASLNFGLRKPMVSGGEASLEYNPDPAYFFVSNPTGSGFNPIRSSNVQLSVNQPLLRGAGRRINLIPVQIAQIGIDQSRWDFKKSAMESVRGIVTEYWDLYSSQAAIAAIDEVLPLYQEIVRLQEEALKAGLAVSADVAKAEAQLNDVELEKLRLESDAVSQELRLRNLIGMEPDLDLVLNPVTEPASVLVSDSAERFLEQALYCQPDIVQQRLNVQIRRLELAVAENQLLPNFDINGLYRLNGVGENLGDALDQLGTLDFRDWQVGANLSVPLGRRAAKAGTLSANRKLQEDSELLQQQIFSVYYDLVRSLQRLNYAYRQFEKADKRLIAAEEWVRGSRLRYQNPNADDGGSNWLLGNLNDYLDAIRFKTIAASEKAELLANYNIELAKIEETKGTLLDFFGVYLAGDPCVQAVRLSELSQPKLQTNANQSTSVNVGEPNGGSIPVQQPNIQKPGTNPGINRSIDTQRQPNSVPPNPNPKPGTQESNLHPIQNSDRYPDLMSGRYEPVKRNPQTKRQMVSRQSNSPPTQSQPDFFRVAEGTDRDFQLTNFR